ALLPRDRVDRGQVGVVGERQEGGHPRIRKRHSVERVTSSEGKLSELDLRPRVAETLDDLRHGGNLRLVPPFLCSVEGKRGREVVEPVTVERRDRADSLLAMFTLRRRLRRAQREAGQAQALGGQLAVISDRLARGALIVAARVL